MSVSNLAAIYVAVNFIEDHLCDEITVGDVAAAAGYSVYHFCRVFNQVVHHSPYDYLMRRRLSESARELTGSERRIIDIALDHGFNNPETYSRAFKRMFGVQPSRYREQGGGDRRLLSAPSWDYLCYLDQKEVARPAAAEIGPLRLVGLVAHVRERGQGLEALWAALEQAVVDLDKDTLGPCYGLAMYPPDWQERGFFYMAARAAETLDVGPTLLVEKTLPVLSCARFAHPGPYAMLGLTLDYVYQTWLPRAGRRLSPPWELEYHGPGFGKTSAIDLYVPLERPLHL